MALTAPSWIEVDKVVIRSNEQITVTWGVVASSDADVSESALLLNNEEPLLLSDGSVFKINAQVAYYELQCRMYNGTSWTDWSEPIQCTENTCILIPSEIFPEIKAGHFLDIRVSAFDNAGLQSTSYRKITDYVSIKGGGVHVCVNGVNREGTPFVYTDGTWKQGVAYIKHNEDWKEGV